MNLNNTRSSGKTLWVAPLRTTVALENGQLLTKMQEAELMFRNNGLLHRNVIIAAGLLSQAQAGKQLCAYTCYIFWAD